MTFKNMPLSILAIEESLIAYAKEKGIPTTMLGTPRALVVALELGPLALRILNQFPGLNVCVVIRDDFNQTEWGFLEIGTQEVFSREGLKEVGAWSAGQ